MSFCPNCGSYVSPGTNICSCGTTFGYDYDLKKKKKQSFKNKKRNELILLMNTVAKGES